MFLQICLNRTRSMCKQQRSKIEIVDVRESSNKHQNLNTRRDTSSCRDSTRSL